MLSPGYGPMTDLGHVHHGGRGHPYGLESIEDQVSTNIGHVIQASNSDLMARGVAIDLIQAAKRVGPQYGAAGHKDLSGEEGFSLDGIITDDRRGHRILSSMAQWNSQ